MSLDFFGNPLPEDSKQILDHVDGQEEQFLFQISSSVDQTIVRTQSSRKVPWLGFMSSGIVAVLILVQCFRLQVVSGQANALKANDNSIRVIVEPAERGLITDKNGVVLASNQRRTALTVDPLGLPKKKSDRQKIYEQLISVAGVSTETIQFIEANLQNIPAQYPVKTRLTQDETLIFTEKFNAVPGVQVTEIPSRQYASLPSLGHLVGYVDSASEANLRQGRDFSTRTGKAGLELVYNTELSGQVGAKSVEVNAQQQVVRAVTSTTDRAAVPGNTLKLSIDSELQQQVATALQHSLEKRKQTFGDQSKLGASAVILDIKTGQIRAMVSLPDYNNQLFAEGISQTDYQALQSNPGNPLLNRAIQGAYAPGSTLKPFVAAAGLEDGIIHKDTSIYTPASIDIGQFRFPDWKLHGQTNTRKAIAESNNIFFYAVGGGWAEGGIKGLGDERLNYYLEQFGLGEKTGIDLPGEHTGLVPDDAWKRSTQGEPWYIGNTYQSSIGQGFLLATPLQMAVGTAAIANGGKVFSPSLVESFIEANGTEVPHTTSVHHNLPISSDNLKTVREGMRQAVETGSARLLNGLTVTSAGKTGTAQFGNQGLTHAWYTGFAPYDDPEIAFAVMIEGGGESFYASVPAAEQILRAYFHEPLAEREKLLSEPSDAKISELAAQYSGER